MQDNVKKNERTLEAPKVQKMHGVSFQTKLTIAKSQASFRIYIYPQKLKIMNVNWSSKNIKQNHGVSFPIKTSTTGKIFQIPLTLSIHPKSKGTAMSPQIGAFSTIQKVNLELLLVTARMAKICQGNAKKQKMGFLSSQDINYCKTSPFPLQYPPIQTLKGQPCASKSEPSFQYSQVKFRYYLSCDYVWMEGYKVQVACSNTNPKCLGHPKS